MSADVPVGDVNDLAAVVAHPQLVERGRWVERESAKGAVDVLEHPFEIDGLPRRGGRIPALGEDTTDILAELASLQASLADSQ